MAGEINYDDNLFFIMTRLQSLKNGLLLGLDHEYTKEYYFNDLTMVDRTLTLFQEKLTNSHQLIKLADYLHGLSRAQSLLVEIIKSIKLYSTKFTRSYMEHEALLDAIEQRQSNGALSIITRLKEGVENYRDVDIISEEELAILMSTE